MNGVEINVDTLLFGNDFLSDETNCEIFLIIQRYIKDTGRLSNRPNCVLRGNGHINFHSSIGI
jgi:hypothetical protein